VSNCTAHAAWTGHAVCHWNGQAHVLSVINAKTRVAQRLHVRLRLLAYAARSTPRGSIGSPLRWGAGVYVIRSGSHHTRSGHVSAPDPAWALIKAQVCLSWNPGTPPWATRTPYREVRIHSRGPVCTRGGPGPNMEARTVYTGVRYFPMGSGLTSDASEYVTFSGHVAVPDPPMWWGQVLLLAQSSRPRLGRVMAWSHIQLFYHVTKNSVTPRCLYSARQLVWI
jgi:hypothetical protein